MIVAADGKDVSSVDDLAGYLDAGKKPGDTVELTVVRVNERIILKATLIEWPQ